MDPVHAAMYAGAEDCRARHACYVWPALEEEEAIILGDSLIKKVRHLRRTSVYAIPGVSLEGLYDEIRWNKVDISFQRGILVCAGTNNLSTNSVDEIRAKLAALVDIIRTKNADCEIMYSGIIIRPRDESDDHHFTFTGDTSLAQKRRDVNHVVKPMLAARGASMIPTWNAVMQGSIANPAMYANDGLHLSDAGVRRITQYLIGNLGRALPLLY
jgi:lysophospholipase L1-like esterase